MWMDPSLNQEVLLAFNAHCVQGKKCCEWFKVSDAMFVLVTEITKSSKKQGEVNVINEWGVAMLRHLDFNICVYCTFKISPRNSCTLVFPIFGKDQRFHWSSVQIIDQHVQVGHVRLWTRCSPVFAHVYLFIKKIYGKIWILRMWVGYQIWSRAAFVLD